MWIYLGVAIFALALIEIYHYKLIPPVADKVFAVVLFSMFFLVSWLRWENGADWDAYVDAFANLKTYDDFVQNDWWEPGYKLVALLINTLDFGYTGFLLLFAMLLFGIKLCFLIRSSCWTQFVFVTLCLSLGDMFFVRQNVAAWLAYASIIGLVRKNYLLAISLCVGAFFIHRSSLPIFLLGLLIVLGFDYGWKRIVFVVILLSPLVYTFVYSNDLLPERYFVAYLENGYFDSKDSLLSGELRGVLKGGFYVACVSRVIYMLQVASRSGGLPYETYKETMIGSIVVITLSALIAATSGFSEVFLRLAVYVFPFLAVLLSARLVLGNVRGGFVIRPIVNFLFVVNLFLMVSSEIDLYFPLKLSGLYRG